MALSCFVCGFQLIWTKDMDWTFTWYCTVIHYRNAILNIKEKYANGYFRRLSKQCTIFHLIIYCFVITEIVVTNDEIMQIEYQSHAMITSHWKTCVSFMIFVQHSNEIWNKRETLLSITIRPLPTQITKSAVFRFNPLLFQVPYM